MNKHSDTLPSTLARRGKLRRLYVRFDDILFSHIPRLGGRTRRDVAMRRVRSMLEQELGYQFHEVDVKRPWGGFFRIKDEQLEKFLSDFFPGLSLKEAHLGHDDAELSPKIMVWMPGQRISWQYHHRRAERWHFLTDAKFWLGATDELPRPLSGKPGEIVQIACGQRHRGGAGKHGYALVAEIWQHTDSKHPSDETDVVRVADDYGRPKHPTPA